MSYELAQAYITIKPVFEEGSYDKIAKDAVDEAEKTRSVLETALGSALGTKIANSFGGSFSTGLGTSLGKTFGKNSGILSKITSGFKDNIGTGIKGALLTGVGGAVAGVGAGLLVAGGAALGTALTKGFDRAVTMQNAEAMMKGIGISGEEAAKRMDDAKQSVLGTIYPLNEAASAASLFAQTLNTQDSAKAMEALVGASALGMKTSLSDLTPVFNKIAAAGRITGEHLHDLRRNGVAAQAALAQHYGVSMAEVESMARNGKISSQDFFDAMVEYSGDAAEALGNTFMGRFANMKAALGRMGEEFWNKIIDAGGAEDGLFAKLTNLFNNIDKNVDFGVLAEGLLNVGSELYDIFADIGSVLLEIGRTVKDVMDFAGITGLLKNIGGLVKSIAATVKPFVKLIGEIAKLLITLIIANVLPVIVAIKAFAVPLLNYAITGLKAVFRAAKIILEAVTLVMGKLNEIKKKALDAIFDKINKIKDAFKNWFKDNMKNSEAFRGLITTLGVIKNAIETLFNSGSLDEFIANVKQVFPVLKQSICDAFEIFKTWWDEHGEEVKQKIIDTIKAAVKRAGEAITEFADYIQEHWPEIKQKITEIAAKVWEFLKEWVPKILQFIKPYIIKGLESLPQLILKLFELLMPVVKKLLLKLLSLIPPLLLRLVGMLKDVALLALNALVNVLLSLPGKIVNLLAKIPGLFSNAFTKAKDLARVALDALVNWLSGLPSRVLSKISAIGTSAGNMIGSAAKGVINSAIDAIQGAINNGIDLINKVTGKLKITAIAHISLPRLATGGVVTRSTIAEIGENGAEAVVPLERNTQWIHKMAQDFQSSLDYSGGGAGGVNVFINNARINNDEAIKQATYDYAMLLARKVSM